MRQRFDPRLFILLTIGFIVATVIGTLSHEGGHYIVAKGLGFSSTVHYAYTDWSAPQFDTLNNFVSKYSREIEQGFAFPGKENYDEIMHWYAGRNLWISCGGPLQTMLTGTIGLALLFASKRRFQTSRNPGTWQWIAIFATLFWLRQSANMVVWFADYFYTHKFSLRGDEIRIALDLHLPFWLLAVLTGTIGMFVLYIVIFKFIPEKQRQTFVLSGIVGGVTGYWLWLYLLGPIILP